MIPSSGWVSIPKFVSVFIYNILPYLLSKGLGYLSGYLVSSTRVQKLFCGCFSAFKWSFDEFVGQKVISPSYSSAILALSTPLPFLNTDWTSGSSWITYYWSLAWRILSITLLAYEMSATKQSFEHSLTLPFFGIGTKTDIYQSYGHCWVFHICWHIQCSTFIALSFRTWSSLAGIPSPPLPLLIAMLPKVHLTSHFRMSGFRWEITSSWLFGSLNICILWLNYTSFSSICLFCIVIPCILTISS